MESFEKLKKRDELKYKKCTKEGINLLYYSNLKYKDNKYYIYNDLNLLLKKIKNEII